MALRRVSARVVRSWLMFLSLNLVVQVIEESLLPFGWQGLEDLGQAVVEPLQAARRRIRSTLV
jgi:hypothetical protein